MGSRTWSTRSITFDETPPRPMTFTLPFSLAGGRDAHKEGDFTLYYRMNQARQSFRKHAGVKKKFFFLPKLCAKPTSIQVKEAPGRPSHRNETPHTETRSHSSSSASGTGPTSTTPLSPSESDPAEAWLDLSHRGEGKQSSRKCVAASVKESGKGSGRAECGCGAGGRGRAVESAFD